MSSNGTTTSDDDVWVVIMHCDSQYDDSYDVKLLGVFTIRSDAEKARDVYWGLSALDPRWEHVYIHRVELNDYHWLTGTNEEREEPVRETPQEEKDEDDLRKAAAQAAAVARVDAALEAERAKREEPRNAVVADAKLCDERESDPYWENRRTALRRRVKWTLEQLRSSNRLSEVEEYLPSFACLDIDF